MVLGAQSTYNHLTNPSYYESLLYPECTHNCRIPGQADMTVTIKRKMTFTVNTNAAGAATVMWQPFFLADTATLESTAFTNTDVLYDGFTAAFGVGASIYTSQNITPGAVSNYRLVSAAMHVVPQSSVLNQAGTIHAAVVKRLVYNPLPAGGVAAATFLNTLIPTIANTPFYREASVSAQEGVRMVYLPNDLCLLEFQGINEGVSAEQPEEHVNTYIATIVGTAANSPFRVDLYQNFEVLPTTTGSILTGLESLCTEDTVPATVWRSVLQDNVDDIVVVSKAVDSHASKKMENKLKTMLQTDQPMRNMNWGGRNIF